MSPRGLAGEGQVSARFRVGCLRGGRLALETFESILLFHAVPLARGGLPSAVPFFQPSLAKDSRGPRAGDLRGEKVSAGFGLLVSGLREA